MWWCEIFTDYKQSYEVSKTVQIYWCFSMLSKNWFCVLRCRFSCQLNTSNNFITYFTIIWDFVGTMFTLTVTCQYHGHWLYVLDPLRWWETDKQIKNTQCLSFHRPMFLPPQVVDNWCYGGSRVSLSRLCNLTCDPQFFMLFATFVGFLSWNMENFPPHRCFTCQANQHCL